MQAYDLFCIGMLTKLLGRVYYTSAACATLSDLTWQCKIKGAGSLPVGQTFAVTTVALIGTLIGQLFWGPG